MNTESAINKSLLYNNTSLGVLYIDLEKLYKEYFNCEFKEFSINKLEKMFNDFKIVLRLIEIFKQSYNRNLNNKLDVDSQSYPKSMRKIYNEAKEIKEVKEGKESKDNINNKNTLIVTKNGEKNGVQLLDL